jgi:enoyl-CoA hydratase/carnithine racemase
VIDATGSDDTISYEVDNGVALVTLNRPDALNAVTMSMEHLLEDVLRRADHDPEVRCIIVTGAGRGFCAGDDVKVQWSDPAMRGAIERLASPRVGVSSMVDVLLRSSTPSVAAVNGPAVGFGMDLALMCDLRVASTDARFSQAYVRMGLVADLPGSWLLPRLVGPAMAAQLLLTGDTVDAATAQAIGLVSMVVPPDELIPAALGLARRKPPTLRSPWRRRRRACAVASDAASTTWTTSPPYGGRDCSASSTPTTTAKPSAPSPSAARADSGGTDGLRVLP